MLALVLLVYLVVEVAHLIIAGISCVVVVVVAEWVIGSSSGVVIVFE